MDSEQRKKLLEEAGFDQGFIDEIVAADRQAEEAGVTDELVFKTIEYSAHNTGVKEKGFFSRWYDRVADYLSKW